jgi:prolyl-tRNA editing enzyme YbaK/EbsC (Cys-tRNA(Pro) deacylase)
LFYNVRMAKLLPKTETALTDAALAHKVFACDPALADTAAFCEHYGFAPDQSANAIIVAGKADPTKYACCVVLATTKLDVNKAVCKLLGVKRASFASGEQTKELTGMEIGGVTPFGIPASVPIYVDAAVLEQPEVVMGGGNRSSKVVLNPQELPRFPGVQVVEGLARPKEG